MSGAIVVCHREGRDLSFLKNMKIPNGKAVNLFSFLKLLNALRTGNMRLSTDALEGQIEAFLICFRDIITRDNKVARRVFDAFKVLKITKVVCPPNLGDRSRFKDLSLCGNNTAD